VRPIRNPIARLGLGLVAFAVLLGGGTSTAAAHIQVAPTVAAPNDAVRFDFLVPGEKTNAQTTKVEVKVPSGVLPYSYADPPGWQRRLVKAPDNSVGRIAWTGRLAPDGFAEFSVLAATPPKPGTLRWKALQFYSDGEVARWIGSPQSDKPAPVTEIVDGAPLQNAGGEGPGGNAESEVTTQESEESASAPGDDVTARALATAALALAVVALALAWRRGRSA
jgi:uncharacterized protein YcnI